MNQELKEQQIEALKALLEYNTRLIKSVNLILIELKEERKDDTDEFQKKILDGINWEIEILNRTLSLINEEKEIMNKEKINNNIIKFGNKLKSKEDLKIAEGFENDILPILVQIEEVIPNIIKEEI